MTGDLGSVAIKSLMTSAEIAVMLEKKLHFTGVHVQAVKSHTLQGEKVTP